MVRTVSSFAAVMMIAASTSMTGAGDHVRGDYVEARTAEIFAGGCIMNSEAETAGRQAVMAWRITAGTVDGVRLDGLAIVAAVAGDRNLGMREMGGEEPHYVRAVLTVDPATSESERRALVRVARELSQGLITEVVRIDVAPIRFSATPEHIDVGTPDAVTLSISKEMAHDPSCGAMQWFKPFSSGLTTVAMGTADAHAFSGTGLGTRWSAPNKRSAFWGRFEY